MMISVSRALVFVVLAAACGKPADPPEAPARIIDLSASIEPLRRELDAHQGEARFLTLLAPS